jgi:hypothetical protein
MSLSVGIAATGSYAEFNDGSNIVGDITLVKAVQKFLYLKGNEYIW